MKDKKFKTSGIYGIINKINNKMYIGKSVNIQARFYAHIHESTNPKLKAYYYDINKALRKYGQNNFELIVIEECDRNLLFEKEIYYIKKYNTFNKGYNMTLGGDGGPVKIGEENGRARLNELDIVFIRTKLLEGYDFRHVYKIYENKISKRGLQHIWWGTSWKHIMSEIYKDRTELFKNSNKGAKDYKRKISSEEYREIVIAKKDGKDRKEYWSENFKDKVTLSCFNTYWYEYKEKIKEM